MDNKTEKQLKLISTVLKIVVLLLIGWGLTTCIKFCNEPDPYENDEFYNQSLGRQLMMEQNGMYKEAEREKQMRREYMRRKGK